jgi:DNA repair protein RadD
VQQVFGDPHGRRPVSQLWAHAAPGEQVEYRDGDLHELDRNGGRRRPHHHGPEERHEFHRMLVGYAVARGYKVGWAAYKFREKFGDWPDARNVAPLDPSREVMSWVRSRNIAFAKSQDRRAS